MTFRSIEPDEAEEINAFVAGLPVKGEDLTGLARLSSVIERTAQRWFVTADKQRRNLIPASEIGKHVAGSPRSLLGFTIKYGLEREFEDQDDIAGAMRRTITTRYRYLKDALVYIGQLLITSEAQFEIKPTTHTLYLGAFWDSITLRATLPYGVKGKTIWVVQVKYWSGSQISDYDHLSEYHHLGDDLDRIRVWLSTPKAATKR